MRCGLLQTTAHFFVIWLEGLVIAQVYIWESHILCDFYFPSKELKTNKGNKVLKLNRS